MSHQTVLYGRIIGTNGSTDNWYDLYKLNKKIIDTLPDEDEYPAIIKSMFISPLVEAGPSLHRKQVIVFGASLKNIDDNDHRLWISKFEALLKRMYWLDVILHFDIELYGKFEHRWKAKEKSVVDMRSKIPIPVADWYYSEFEIDI